MFIQITIPSNDDKLDIAIFQILKSRIGSLDGSRARDDRPRAENEQKRVIFLMSRSVYQEMNVMILWEAAMVQPCILLTCSLGQFWSWSIRKTLIFLVKWSFLSKSNQRLWNDNYSSKETWYGYFFTELFTKIVYWNEKETGNMNCLPKWWYLRTK